MKIIYSNNLWRSLLIVPRVCSKWNIYSGKSTREFVTLEPWPTPSIPLPQISATETPFQKCVANNTGLPVPESPGKGYSSSRSNFQHTTPPTTHTYTNVERLNARWVEPKGQRIPSFTQPHAHSRGIASQEYWGLGLPHLPHSKGIGSIAEDTS